jgi:hypothetical protein
MLSAVRWVRWVDSPGLVVVVRPSWYRNGLALSAASCERWCVMFRATACACHQYNPTAQRQRVSLGWWGAGLSYCRERLFRDSALT